MEIQRYGLFGTVIMKNIKRAAAKKEDGFSYIEVMVALVILMVGILGLMAGISASVLLSRGQQQQITARHIAATTMESIMSAKETDADRFGWKSVGNVGSNPDADGVPQGIFVNGVTTVLSGAGDDEILGTADDNGAPVAGFLREIVITDDCDPDRPSANCPTPGTAPVRMRTVRVTVTYYMGSTQRNETVTTVLSDYATNN